MPMISRVTALASTYRAIFLIAMICACVTKAGAAPITFTVTTNEAVLVTGPGTPRIAIDVGGVQKYASYQSGSGTTTLTFAYQVQPGDFDADGITVASAIDPNGGSITDLAGNTVSSYGFTLSGSTTNLKVQTYTASFDAAITGANASSVSFTLSKLPTLPANGYSYSYTLTGAAGGSTGASDVSYNTSSLQVSNLDISAFPVGELTLTVTIKGPSGTGTPFIVKVNPSFTARVLDGLSTSAQAAYSTRLLRSAYTGPLLRVRRSSDNQEMNIGPGIGGGLAAVTVTNFCSTGSCFVTTWFDQSGNGRNASQLTNSAQPRLVNAGSLETLNGRPSLRFTSASATFLGIASSPVAGLASTYINAAGAVLSDQNWARLFDFGSGTTAYMTTPLGSPSRNLSASGRFRITTNTWTSEQGPIPAPAVWWTANQPFVAGFEHTGSVMTIWVNGASAGTAGGITIAPSAVAGSQNYIGKSQYAGDAFPDMNVAEFIVLSASNTADRQLLEGNQKGWYGTP